MNGKHEREIQWVDSSGTVRKIVFEPDCEGEFFRTEYERLGDSWRQVGREPVENVSIRVGSLPVGGEDSGGVTGYHGP